MVSSIVAVQYHIRYSKLYSKLGFPSDTVVENPPASAREARDSGLIPVSGKIPWRRRWQLLQYSCLENRQSLADRGAWRATVHGVAKRQTGLSD